jgi:hypothetical protein
MFPRSTACRHGLGRTSPNAESITSSLALADEQVGRLDVAVRKPGVPHLPDDEQALVDDWTGRRRPRDLLRVVEELGDE